MLAKSKKFLALFLTLCMVVGTMSTAAIAVEEGDTDGTEPTACEHVWDEGTVTKEPTCTEAGEKTFTCTLCGEKNVSEVEATGHTYENGVCTGCGAEEPKEPEDMTQESLQAAIDAAEAGSTVTLTGNVALTGTINITKSLTLDLNSFGLNGSSVDQLILINSTGGEAVDVTIQNGTLDGGKSEGRGDEYVRGGAIYSTAGQSSTLTVKNCTFVNNAAGIGSALWTDSSLYMENCTVKNNVGTVGTNYSSAVAVKGPTTSEGADAPKVPSVTITSCTFEGNGRDDPGALGGAVYMLGVDTVVVSGGSFTNNLGGTGGAVYCSNSNSVSFTGVTFTGNSGVSGSGGGGAYADNTKNLSFDGCTFTNNTGNGMGGAICSGLQCSLTVTNCTFTENTTSGNGGAISHQSGPAVISDSTFTGNTAAAMGGAILVADTLTKDTTLKLERCTIKESTGGYGGALAIQGLNSSDFGFYVVPATVDSETTITNSTGTVYGGAVYSSYVDLDLGADITGATSPNFGGAVYAYLGDLNVTGDITGAVGANYGGAIYANQSNVTVSSSITGNSVTLHSTGVNGYGGGIASLYGTLTITEGAAVYNNTAEGAGDDIYSLGMEGYPNVLNLPTADKMSGDLTLTGGEKITGWYVDGLKGADTTARWSVDGYYEEYTPVADETTYLALKAAHGEPYVPTPSYDYYRATVNYLDKDTGEKIAASYTTPSRIEGSRYDVSEYDAIAIDGYTYDSTSGDALSGILNSDKTINVYYVAEETDIDDGETPTTDLPDNPDPDEGGETDIPDEGTPTTDLPDEPGTETEIPDGETPAGNLPQTGTTSNAGLFQTISGVFLCLAVVFGGVTVVLFRKEREQA